MVLDPKKRQKKMMKQRQKDKARHTKSGAQKPFTELSDREKVRNARRCPLHETRINKMWRTQGFAEVLVSRQQPDGHFIAGIFLVDIYCLGVKDAFAVADVPSLKYEDLRETFVHDDETVDCDPVLAHAVIYGAVDFAARFGFHPHRDFSLAQNVLDERSTYEAMKDIEFGHEGKPLYVAGPYDDPDRIIEQLDRTAGPGNYHYIAPVGGEDDLGMMEEDEE